ncbi:MAG TPA: TonB-dependent receptor [Saprospiraceae bacterium]|nr:TonB-dependent receptor [Saprospiraceae bacterium]HNT21356.1 TonB-dependent receptor [Saprospiraceae bacterium]
MRRSIVGCLIFIQTALGAQAQQSMSDTILEVKEVVVTASRMAQARASVNMPVQRIEREKLNEVASRNLVEALQHEGIWMQKTNQGGGSPFIRGLTGNQVLIVKDGIRLNNSIYRYGPNQYLSLQSLFEPGQIEVIRGSGAVQYGSDAIGGVIHLISSNPVTGAGQTFSGNVYTQWASSGVEKLANAGIRFSKNKFGLSMRGALAGYGDLQGGKKTGKQIPSGYDEGSADLKARWENPAGAWDLSWSATRQTQVPVYHKVVLEGFQRNQSDQLSHHLAFLRNKYEFGGSRFFKQIETTLSWQKLSEQRSLQKKTTDPVRKEEDIAGVWGFSSQLELSPSNNTSGILGVDLYRDKVNSTAGLETTVPGSPALRGLYPDGATYMNAGFFNDWNFDWESWDLALGWRYNIYQLKTNEASLGEVVLKPSALVWHLALGRTMGAHRIFIHADKTFRAPNIDDAGTLGIVDFRYEVPNYELSPEKGLHLGAGHRWVSKSLQLETSLFYLKLHDLITRTAISGDSIQGYPVFIKKNADRSYIYGLESSLNLKFSSRWTVRGMIQYSFGQNQSADEPIRRIPPLFCIGKIQYQPGLRWSFYAESLNAGRQDRLSAGDISDNRISRTGTPAWNILNLGLTVKLKSLECRAGVENLFNQDYRVHGSGINGAGRLLRLGIGVSW